MKDCEVYVVHIRKLSPHRTRRSLVELQRDELHTSCLLMVLPALCMALLLKGDIQLSPLSLKGSKGARKKTAVCESARRTARISPERSPKESLDKHSERQSKIRSCKHNTTKVCKKPKSTRNLCGLPWTSPQLSVYSYHSFPSN